MPIPSNPTALAQQARRAHVEGLLSRLPAVVDAIEQGARVLATQSAERAVAAQRRDLVPELHKAAPLWLQEPLSLEGSRKARPAAFSPDGQRLVIGGRDRIVRVLESGTGQELKALAGQAAEVEAVAFAPDGLRIAFETRAVTVLAGAAVLALAAIGLKLRVDAVLDRSLCRRLLIGSA